MSTSPTPALADEVTSIDTHARVPLTLLAGAAVAWLVASGLLALVTAIQLHSPAFLADCAALTHGRAQALRETAFLYGWAGNAGLALGLWILGRLGGHPLRALNWAVAGTFAWNVGLLVGLAGIATGDMTSFAALQLPRYVQPVLVVAAVAIAIPGVLAWSGRKREGAFAAQWYAVAALFLLPWFWTATQTVLVWAPVRGVVQTIAASWHAQSLLSLWLVPLALSAAYYAIPKLTGRTLPSYEAAPLAFWVLIVVGGWNFGRHLIGGPVPAWIPTMAVVGQSLLLFHYLVVGLNLRGAIGGGGVTLRFFSFGLVAYVVCGVLDTLVSFRGIAVHTQFTFLAQALDQLFLHGAVSMLLLGGLYFMVPRLTGRAWAFSGLVRGHASLLIAGVLVTVLALGSAGVTQDGLVNHSTAGFGEVAARLSGSLLTHTVGQFLMFTANLLLAVNFARSACTCGTAEDVSQPVSPSSAGVSAS